MIPLVYRESVAEVFYSNLSLERKEKMGFKATGFKTF